MWELPLNSPPAAVKQNSPKLRPAIPAQKPNQASNTMDEAGAPEIHSVLMHRVASALAARRNKFVARHLDEPIVSPLILSPPICPEEINAETESQLGDAPKNPPQPCLKRHSGLQIATCLHQAVPFGNQFFSDFIQHLF
jgi:hypothetical protein